jgi:hypothetical protein
MLNGGRVVRNKGVRYGHAGFWAVSQRCLENEEREPNVALNVAQIRKAAVWLPVTC